MNFNSHYNGILIMGPFGCGKSTLCKYLDELGLGEFINLEPIIYEKFEKENVFDLESATNFLRENYNTRLSSNNVAILESTGVNQKALILEIIEQFDILTCIMKTPKSTCLERIVKRNYGLQKPLDIEMAKGFYDNWHNNVSKSYKFDVELAGSDLEVLSQKIIYALDHG